MAQLVVILGAGASFDCSSSDRIDALQPPLVQDLFAPRFSSILHEYPLAEAAAADIRRAVTPGAVPLEQYLQERLRDATNRYAQQRYREVPLYLQDLFAVVSQTNGRGFTTHPDHYDVLANAALELDEVVFVTLNYDTLLDERLFIYQEPPATIDSYIEPGRNWSLLKLHGSWNWGRRVTSSVPFPNWSPLDIAALNRLFSDIDELALSDEITLRHGGVADMRNDRNPESLHYPALSVPLGSEDELVCPSSHADFLRERLRAQDGLNILVIGYSGLDREVLRLLRESGNSLRTMLVANGSEPASLAGVESIAAVWGGGFREEWISPHGFGQLVATGTLREWIDRLSSAR